MSLSWYPDNEYDPDELIYILDCEILRQLTKNMKKRNFKVPNYEEINSLDKAKELIESLEENQVLKIIVHDHNVRSEIHSNFEFTHKIVSKTEKGIDLDYRSTILYHVDCKNAAPYEKFNWENEIKASIGSSRGYCPKCNVEFYSDYAKNLKLSARHNIMVIKKIIGIKHNKCRQVSSAESLTWNRNTEHGECFDSYCNHCHEKICFDHENGTMNRFGDLNDSYNDLGYSLKFY